MRDDVAEFVVALPELQALYCCKTGKPVNSGSVWLSAVNAEVARGIYGDDVVKAVAEPAKPKAAPARAKSRSKARASKPVADVAAKSDEG